MRYLKLFENFNKVYYHGSAKKFDTFDKGISNYSGTIYFTESKPFAMQFASDRGTDKTYLYTVELYNKKPFDPFNKLERDKLIPVLKDLIEKRYEDKQTGAKFYSKYIVLNGESIQDPDTDQSVQYLLWRIENGSWRIIESQPVIDSIRSMGYDSIITIEKGQENVAVFDPSLIKILDIEEIEN